MKERKHTITSLLKMCKWDGECLIWQGTVRGRGYPTAKKKRQRVSARALLMELSKIEKPFPAAVVTATCGCKLCMNRAHLIWASRQECGERGTARGAYARKAETKFPVVKAAKEHVGNPFAGLFTRMEI
jgi:hypothetical protein